MHRPSKSRYCLNNILHRHTASLFLFAIIMDTAWQGRMNGKSPVIKALIDDITAIRESKFNMNAWTDVFRQGSLSGTDVSLSVKVTWTKEHWLLSCPWFKHYKETVWISELLPLLNTLRIGFWRWDSMAYAYWHIGDLLSKRSYLHMSLRLYLWPLWPFQIANVSSLEIRPSLSKDLPKSNWMFQA